MQSVQASHQAWARLIELDSRYELPKRANSRGRGQKGTTEPWQNPARELARIHGPCWLTAEIAVAGAASAGTLGSGTIDRDGHPFGENVDYGTFVIEVHRGPSAQWWRLMYDSYTDSLSRRMWSLALLATATTETVTRHLPLIDSCLRQLTGTRSSLRLRHPQADWA